MLRKRTCAACSSVAEEPSLRGTSAVSRAPSAASESPEREISRAVSRITSSKTPQAALKGDRLRFRVVEKPGQIVGLSEPFQPPSTYPFRVAALKTSQMVFIPRQDLVDVLSVFHGPDADAVCQVLRSDFLICWETLKPRGRDKSALEGSKYIDAGLAAKQARELADLREKLIMFDRRLDGCLESLSTVQAQTSLLPQMQAALKALVEAHGTA